MAPATGAHWRKISAEYVAQPPEAGAVSAGNWGGNWGAKSVHLRFAAGQHDGGRYQGSASVGFQAEQALNSAEVSTMLRPQVQRSRCLAT